jgi:AraC-like DNA-binding protein
VTEPFGSRFCYSLRLVRPFLAALRRYPEFPQELLAPFELLDPDARLPVSIVHDLLAQATTITADPDIGLKAALETGPGDYGALEYVVRSAPTFREGALAAGRYMRLLADALDVRIAVEGPRAMVILDSRVPLARPTADFQSAAFYVAGLLRTRRTHVPAGEAWFTHPAPLEASMYERVFSPIRVRFDAPFNGFVFDASLLDAPFASADPALHAIIRKHAELLLADLPRAESLTQRVRELIAKQLARGNPTIRTIAIQLHTSPRTLGRRLETEGTTFKELLDDSRRQLALHHVGARERPMSEIALLLGFSQSAAFHRAFKRWTAQTPLEYRRARRS